MDMLLSEILCQIHNFFYLQLLRQKLKIYVVNNRLGMSNWKQIPFLKIMLSCLICALFFLNTFTSKKLKKIFEGEKNHEKEDIYCIFI